MTTKTILMVLPILFTVTLLVIPYTTYAHEGHDHGPGGGGGCSDCSPPTLGVDSSGQQKVSGGFSINGQTIDVDMFKQELEPQTFKTGEPVEITLKIYENLGYSGLKHAEINLGYEDKFVSGVMVPHYQVTMEWSKTFDGKTTVTVHDKQNLVTDVDVQVLDNDPIIGMKFAFTPVEEFDASTIVTRIWDQGRNSNVNYFHNAMEIVSDKPLTLLTNLPSSQQDVVEEESVTTQDDPKIEQIHLDITCSAGEVHLLRISNGYPVCVDESEALVLTQNNWAVYAQ